MSKRTANRTPKPRGDAAIAAPRGRRGLWIAAALVGGAAMLAWGLWAIRPRTVLSPKEEAGLALKRGEAAKAERLLARASDVVPNDPGPWLLRLELLRVEDRQIEALRVGWDAYRAVRGPSQQSVLRAITLAMLADTPADLARDTLARWIAADPDDVDARVARLQRIAAQPRAGDPDRPARIDTLAKLVADHPEHLAAREALILALADSGEVDRGRSVLAEWPQAGRDARYHRLAGRWALEYDRQPARAVESFRESLKTLPHDWRTRSRLARALQNAGLGDEAKRAARDVERLREALDPVVLGPRLDHDLATLNDPKSRLDLADLCARAGLANLADAWRIDAEAASPIDPLRADQRPPPTP